MGLHQVLVGLFSVIVIFLGYWLSKGRKNDILSRLRGPTPTSLLLGNYVQYFKDEVGTHEFQWQERYGNAYRIKGLFGEDQLLISDPKALQHVYQTSGTDYVRTRVRREFGRLIAGKGIVWARGDDHRRHRKILGPAFSAVETRGMIPVFIKTAQKLCDNWKSRIAKEGHSTGRVEISGEVSRAALDAIGEAAFNYDFQSLDNKPNGLAEAFRNLSDNSFSLPSPKAIFAQHALNYVPVSALRFLTSLPSRSLAGLQRVDAEGYRVSREVLNERLEEIKSENGDEKEDILSLLIKANTSASEKTKLSQEELMAQIRTVILAGFETVGSTVSFLLYEVARRPDVQSRVREEVNAHLQGRSDDSLDASDLDSLPYTSAVIKEAMRIHPVVYGPILEVLKDDIIPLSKPVIDRYGVPHAEIPIAKGSLILTSFAGYNRLTDVWGPDAHDFKPERWLEDAEWKVSRPFGIYSGLGNFASGGVSCLGWRFAVYEIHTYLIQIIRRFELSYPQDLPPIIRAAGGVMAPVVRGHEEKGKRLMLEMKILN
ncbi:cytochrome P450 [Pluteus cervinus]|uniref:Cytochrome P450 n=1 Tax=Pluteus cervinus TaxID=181527 RepID=A0ACD3ALY7_9AGAR|nr:cytochrome P450 [Pluteus cervinus]